MRVSRIAMFMITLLFLSIANLASAQTGDQPQGQSGATQPQAGQPSAQPRTQSQSGSKTIEGCLERQADGFAVRTEEGLYPLNTERDLTAYIGKRVRLEEKWDAKGTVTTAPPAGSASTGSAPAASSAAPPGRPSAFSGDFHLHVEGSVVGNCASKQ